MISSFQIVNTKSFAIFQFRAKEVDGSNPKIDYSGAVYMYYICETQSSSNNNNNRNNKQTVSFSLRRTTPQIYTFNFNVLGSNTIEVSVSKKIQKMHSK